MVSFYTLGAVRGFLICLARFQSRIPGLPPARGCCDDQKMQDVHFDPVRALARLPLDQGGQTGRQWLQNTVAWLTSAPADSRGTRLRYFAEGISGDIAIEERFKQIWTEAYPPRLYAEAGLPEAASPLRELIVRVKKRVLPQVDDDLDLYATLRAADLQEEHAECIVGLSAEEIAPWRELFGQSHSDLIVAIRLLALRAASIGLSRDVMRVMPHRYETESPFLELVNAAERLAGSSELPETRKVLEETVLQCRVSSGLAHAIMEERGISADLVFRLDLVIAQLDRIEALLRMTDGSQDGRSFASMLIRAVASERGAQTLLRNSANRVARRVVAHTGKSGEHYIAGNRSEWISMGYGAMGAGGITALTALFKYRFAGMAMAPLWIGVAHSLNYAASFVLMQFLGWRLASKMPAMTAAALCDAMDKDDGMQAEVDLVAAITRTQAIVTAGNLLGAIPLAVLIDLLIQWSTGKPFLTPEAARHGVESMHLFRSLTVPFAALTGCFLWISSLFAGWTANWMVLNRLPEAIAQNRRLRGLLGERAAVKMAGVVRHHFSGAAGYVCLGLLLGLLPFISVFAGVPVEVRHITLASASLGYAVRSLIWSGSVPWGELGGAGLGLLATGMLNFSVSFSLGLWLALRARYVGASDRRKLIAALWSEFRHHPARFFWRHESETGAMSGSAARGAAA
jgi:site-specific recombinase